MVGAVTEERGSITHPDRERGRVVDHHVPRSAPQRLEIVVAVADELLHLRGEFGLAAAAIENRHLVTALDGVPMGTRCGAIDAGAVTYMQRELGLDVAQLERMLYEESGLKGLSGVSSDMQALLASTDPQAAFAVEYFALKVAQYAAMLAVSMGGLDALVFTGGIGENAAPVRNAILARMQPLGRFRTLVIAANEEKMMALHAKRLLARQ